MLTAGPVSRPFTVAPYVHFVPAAAAVFYLFTMEKDIFISQPCLPHEDVSLATTSVVSSRGRRTIRKLNELHRSKIDENRALASFSLITAPEAALNELSASHPTESCPALGKGLKASSSQRTKRNLFELHSSKNGGERALASSPHSITFPKVKTIVEATPVRRNQQLTPTIDSAISISARRSFGMLNELCSSKSDEERVVTSLNHSKFFIKEKKIAESLSVLRYKRRTPFVSNSARRAFGTLNELRSSKTDGERAVASSPHTKPSTMEEKIGWLQHKLPHDNPAPQGHENAVAEYARCLNVNLNEPLSSTFDGEQVLLCPPQCPTCESSWKGFHNQSRVRPLSEWQHGCHYQENDGELASASSLSREFYYDRVRLFPLGECQPGCHYKSWLFQARNHVRWRELVYTVGLVCSGANRLLKNGSGC